MDPTHTTTPTIAIAWYAPRDTKHPRPDVCTPIAFVETLADALCERGAAKHDLWSWAPHVVRDGETRANAAIVHMTAIVIDVDDGPAPAEIVRRAAFACAAYSSPSDRTEGPRRTRVIAFTDAPHAPHECAHARLALAHALGLAPECGVAAALDPARVFYAGVLENTPARELAHNLETHAPLDVRALLNAPLPDVWRALLPGARVLAPRPRGAYADASDAERETCLRIAAEMPPSIAGQGGDAALLACAVALQSVTEDPAAIREALDVFNARAEPPWDNAKLAREAERAAMRAAAPESRLARKLARKREASRVAVPGPAGSLVLDVTRQGTPRATILNVTRVIAHAFPALSVRYELSSGRVLVCDVPDALGYFPDGEWTDVHTTALVTLCESMDLGVTPGAVDRAVEIYAHTHAYNAIADTLLEYARAWDSTPRVDAYFTRYLGADDAPGPRAVSRVFLLGLAARGLRPGEKVDTCPIIIGYEGTRKSTSLRTLVGDAFFADSPLPIGDKDAAQAIRGVLLWEFQENHSLSAREVNAVKAFLSQSSDRYRASFGRHTQTVPRTCVFASTSNERHSLLHGTEHRRFLPVFTRAIDIDAIARDRVQILGEAVARVQRGEKWHPTPAETEALAGVRTLLEARDEWQEIIAAWLVKRGEADTRELTVREVTHPVTGAIPIAEDRLDKRAQARVAECLRALGYEACLTGARRSRAWRRATAS